MDTAHPDAGAETDRNVQLANAADAFKAFTSEQPVRPERVRDEQGRFAPEASEEAPEDDAELGQEPETGEIDDEGEEAAVEAQPMPSSWPADQAEHWNGLPAETQAYIAEREAERDRGLNLKMQESANARKAAEAQLAEANTNRTQYAEALDALMAAIQPVKPDPRAFGAGTGQYHSEAYALALAEYESGLGAFAQLQQQRDTIRTEAQQQEAQQFDAWKQEWEAQYAPKFLADVPDLTDGTKAEPIIRDLVSFAIANGIPESVFSPEEQKFVTSAQLHILWKAQQYDKLRTQPPAVAKPKPASPAIRPGVSSPRGAQKAAQRQQISDRLAREGTVEAGAAMWKTFLKG